VVKKVNSSSFFFIDEIFIDNNKQRKTKYKVKMSTLLPKLPIPFEPKKKNRFIVRFPSSMGIQEWYLSTASRPKATIGSVEIPYINTSFYVAGRYKWDSISMTFRDPIGPSASQALMEWFRQHAESVTGRMGYAAGYKKNIEIDMLDPNGVTIERWSIVGGFITDLNFNDLSYSEEGLADISVTIQPDYCVQLY
jgi:hypothetical protein